MLALGCGRVDDHEVLTAEDVAELLKLSPDYVRRLSREGVLPCHRLPGGRSFRYFRTEVLDWLRSMPVGDASHDRP